MVKCLKKTLTKYTTQVDSSQCNFKYTRSWELKNKLPKRSFKNYVLFLETNKLILWLCYVECSPGKYYWKESDATEFYACVEPASGVEPLLPGYVINAIKMRCSSGTYMCTRYNDVSDLCFDDYLQLFISSLCDRWHFRSEYNLYLLYSPTVISIFILAPFCD